jgi:hypothetical protein
MNKFIKALARHELARQNEKLLKRKIAMAIELCPIDIKAHNSDECDGSLWTQDKMHTKNHLWHAFQARDPSSCGWGSVPLCEDGVIDALSEGSEFECEHCLHAYRFIIERKAVRRELGYARLSLRALGRQALLMVAKDDN